MANCSCCDQEMTDAVSCGVEALHVEGRRVAMVPADEACGDCLAPMEGMHHLGCDQQRCPLCRGQMISCGCRFDEDIE